MKTIWRKLVHVLLILILAAGTTGTLAGCRRQGPLERAGEALEEAGEAARGDR